MLLSALSGEGVDDLLDCAARMLGKDNRVRTVAVPASNGELRAWLHARGEILSSAPGELEEKLEGRMSQADWARFDARWNAEIVADPEAG